MTSQVIDGQAGAAHHRALLAGGVDFGMLEGEQLASITGDLDFVPETRD